MTATDPDPDRNYVSATTNEINDSTIGTSIQAGTIGSDGVRIQNFYSNAIDLISADCAIVGTIVASTPALPWPWRAVAIICGSGALIFIGARRLRRRGRLVCIAIALPSAVTLFWLPVDRPKPLDGVSSAAPTPGIVLQKVTHAFTPQLDRVAAFVYNPATGAVPLKDLSLYLDFDAAHWHHEPPDRTEWHFEVGAEMFLGPASSDGVTRMHGTVRANGTEFELPLVGQGFVTADGSWRRLLTFSPQAMLPAGQTTELTIDIPTTFPVKRAGPHGTTDELTKVQFALTTGSLFTHVLVRTPTSVSHACDFVRKNPDPALCETIDPIAMVNAP